MKKQREQSIQAKYYALQQKDLERKDQHMNKVLNEFKTAQMQAKVIKSLSNIENLMVNKLSNTQQKLNVLQTSDKEDVIEFLGMDRKGSSRKKNRSGSKFRNRINNIRSIDGTANEAIKPRNPPMQFYERPSALDPWQKKPKVTMLNQSIDAHDGKRNKSRSKSKNQKNLAYVSIMSAPRSRSKSSNKSPSTKFRSASVKSRKSSKGKDYKKLFQKQSKEHSTSPFNESIDGLNDSSMMPPFTTSN